jgi:hypothetical protein
MSSEKIDHSIYLVNSNYQSLLGILCGGFYLHNISLPIYRCSKNPKNNYRDVFIGFFLVFLSYIACGCLGYFGFSNSDLFAGQKIDQNCLNMFSVDSPLAVLIRICTFFQLFAATALLFACQRAQLLLLFTGKQEATSRLLNTGMNLTILVGPLLLGIGYPHVGKLAGIMGAIGCLFTIYLIPITTFLKHKA